MSETFEDLTGCGYNVNALPLNTISEEEVERERDAERCDSLKVTKAPDSDEREAAYNFYQIASKRVTSNLAANERVVFPEDNQLLLDIDSPEAEAIYNKNKPKFTMHIAEIVDEIRTTSRGGNTHITVTLDRNIDPGERVMFQAFLGSDPMREMLSYVRIINDDEHPTLFIENKPLLLGAAPEVLSE